ncbi:MAG TPA: M56 family metallopeptidase [Fimbriimonadaceae bacterium]|nr:M56 family metallopeptidase [Fimbriimonadaceae bacterium]
MTDATQQILDRLIAGSVGGGIAVAIALLVTVAFKRLNPTVLSWIWRLAILKVAVSLVWLSPIELNILPTTFRHSPAPVGRPLPPTPSHSSPSSAASSEIAPQRPEISWPAILCGVWLLGFLGVAGVRARRPRLPKAVPVEDTWLLALLDGCRGLLRLKRPVAIEVTDEPISPILVGLLRPRIIVPSALTKQDREGDLRLVLIHELCHLKRRDPYWTALAGLVRHVLYFHPLMWILGRPWNLAQEAACDSLAMETAPAGQASYAETLVRLLRCSERRSSAGLAVVPTFDQKSMMKRRLDWIAGAKALSRGRAVLLAGAGIVVLAGGIVPWRVDAAESPKSQGDAPQTQPIGDVDWSTPRLASAADSNGFRILEVKRLRGTEDATYDGSGPMLGIQWPEMTTAVWIKVPDALQGKEFDATVSTPSGEVVGLRPTFGYLTGQGDGQSKSILSVALPIGYSDDVRTLTLRLLLDGKGQADWTFDSLPKTPRLLSAGTTAVRERTVRGMTLRALAFRDTANHGDRDREINWGVVSMSNPPRGEQWEHVETDVTFDLASTLLQDYGHGGRIPVSKWSYDYAPFPSDLTLMAFASSLKLAKIHTNLVRYDTHEETIELTGLRIEPSKTPMLLGRGVREDRFQIVNDADRKFTTPSGLELTFAKQNGSTPVVPLYSGGNHFFLILTTPQTDHPSLPQSPLFRRYHRPLEISIEEEGLGSVGSCLWKDGKIELEIDAGKALSSGPVPPLKLKFIQRTDLETIPMDFVVPIEDQNLDRPVHKSR